MNKKAVLSILALLAVLAIAWSVRSYNAIPTATTSSTTPGATTSVPVVATPQVGWIAYTDDADGFSVNYPDDYTVNKKHTYSALGPGKEIHGVSFTIPASLADGTNLSKDSYLSVEILKSGACTAASFISDAEETKTIDVSGKEWTVAKGGGVGAGNFYDETVYAFKGEAHCYGLRLFIHSTNIGNYDPGTVTEFDRSALDDVFAQFRAGFVAH